MKRILFIMVMAVSSVTLTDIKAQVSINYDSKTVQRWLPPMPRRPQLKSITMNR